MGLDMYLNARRTFYRPFGNEAPEVLEARNAAVIAAEAVGLKERDNIDYITVEREAGYWRKANAIHAWFVKHCQDGVDECQTSAVYRSHLVELRELCTSLLANRNVDKAKKLLPPQSGFFFGSTNLDDGYWQDLTDTVKIIDYCLSLPDDTNFTYHSSW